MLWQISPEWCYEKLLLVDKKESEKSTNSIIKYTYVSLSYLFLLLIFGRELWEGVGILCSYLGKEPGEPFSATMHSFFSFGKLRSTNFINQGYINPKNLPIEYNHLTTLQQSYQYQRQKQIIKFFVIRIIKKKDNQLMLPMVPIPANVIPNQSTTFITSFK